METHLRQAVARIAADRTSGASVLLPQAIAILREARRKGPEAVAEVGLALCQAQPCMGAIWNAVAIALGGETADVALDRFERRAARAGEALARFAVDLLTVGEPDDPAVPLRITTCSASGSVLRCLTALRARRRLVVACAEGRPVYEGRILASALAGSGIDVEFYTDAGVGLALAAARAVLVGADAVGPEWIVNKVGTGQLAAAAARLGVPVYVAVARSKFVAAALAGRLGLRKGRGAEVWKGSPPRVTVRNPYFERVSTELISAAITDIGVLGPDDLREVCRVVGAEVPSEGLIMALDRY